MYILQVFPFPIFFLGIFQRKGHMPLSKIRVLMLAAALVCAVSTPPAAQEEKPKPVHAPNALPGVEPEMLTPEYWIALQPDADKTIMTPAEIEEFNEKNRTREVVLRDFFGKPDPLDIGTIGFTDLQTRGALMHMLRPLDLPEILSGDSLHVWFANLTKWLNPRDFYDDRNAIYSEEMKRGLIAGMNENTVPATVTRKFGIVVNHTNVRFFPTDVPGYSDTIHMMDLFQATSLLSGNPVAILHESAEGDFCYVESHLARGWVPSENVALGTREEVRRLTGEKNFLMATAHRVPVYGDPGRRNFARYLYYAATMPFLGKDAGGFVVRMPYRKADGSIGTAKGYLRSGADVHIGWLPYTKRNVIVQIFKLLNQPYGWIDQDNKRACSGTMRVLLQCFGIRVGAYPSFILPASDRVVYYDPKLPAEEKTKEVEKLEPVITMGGNAWHIVLLLGKARNGKLYFMHQAGWGYEENGQHYIVNRTTLNPADFKWYDINSPNIFTTFRQ